MPGSFQFLPRYLPCFPLLLNKLGGLDELECVGISSYYLYNIYSEWNAMLYKLGFVMLRIYDFLTYIEYIVNYFKSSVKHQHILEKQRDDIS